MNTIELHIRGKRHRFSGPSGWAELTAHQAVSLMRLRAQIAQRAETAFAALDLLYGLKKRHQRWVFDARFLRRKGVPEEQIVLILEQGQSLLDTLLWIGEPDKKASFPVHSFRRFDFHFGTPYIWLSRLLTRQRYVGPLAGLVEISFGEFMFADRAFRAKDLPQLAAILYRPKAETFDKHTAEHRAILFADLDPALLALISQNFADTLDFLSRHFRRVFAEPLSTGTVSKAGKSAGWLDIAINMAKLDVTKIGQIEQTNLYLALKVLDEQIRQAEELEEALAKNKS
ncbi:hypothetical protein G8759_31355 [Spirosoma aureum]|uniref:Uncharacterized protein n=1 Tax=Spirosoma aureum TaxID=2692134 RepID=A0A6G9AWH2_9BACT|nr:hypothetical protein [Spirosoma aureum]QIP16822.1 hypothetical protein G8759_31355 [Spirosoma aureum]